MTTTNQTTSTVGSESSNAIKGVRLSVYVPLKCGEIMVSVFRVEAVNTLAWFREHADELARLCVPDTEYTALHLEALAL